MCSTDEQNSPFNPPNMNLQIYHEHKSTFATNPMAIIMVWIADKMMREVRREVQSCRKGISFLISNVGHSSHQAEAQNNSISLGFFKYLDQETGHSHINLQEWATTFKGEMNTENLWVGREGDGEENDERRGREREGRVRGR